MGENLIDQTDEEMEVLMSERPISASDIAKLNSRRDDCVAFTNGTEFARITAVNGDIVVGPGGDSEPINLTEMAKGGAQKEQPATGHENVQPQELSKKGVTNGILPKGSW